MRILPRSKRGTWALAAATWLGGCAGIWCLLSGAPRVALPYQEAGSMHAFTAEGLGIFGRVNDTHFVAPEYKNSMVWDERIQNGPFNVWSLQTGRPLATWRQPAGVTVHKEFPEFAAALISDNGPEGQSLYLLDMRTGRRELLPWKTPYSKKAYLTAGGRYFVYVPDQAGPDATCWWDRETGKIASTFPGLVPIAMAANGRWVTVERAANDGDPNRFSVRESATGRELTNADLSEDYSHAWLSADGKFLLVDAESQTLITEVSGGRRSATSFPRWSFVVLPDARQVLALDPPEGPQRLIRSELATGREIGRCEIPSRFDLIYNPNVGGRYLLFVGYPATGRFEWIREYVGKLPILSRIIGEKSMECAVVDPIDGQEVARVRPTNLRRAELSPDGRTLVCISRDGQFEFWDIPPRKPLSWFAIAAGVWALPVAWFARRRVWRLKMVS